jgi:acetoin utilization deacetylase AcuC-like enzyme
LDEVELVHDPAYLDKVQQFCADGGGKWDPDTLATEGTWKAALASAGLARWAAKDALEGPGGHETPFSIGRPPGHHAITDDAMGFCFINNAAVAARAVITSGLAETAAIIDWDVHHGNGIQDIFYSDDDIYYASIHEAGLYPGTGEIEETGDGDAAGTTLNLPLPAGAGDPEYRVAFEEVIVPLLEDYGPDLLLISAGFDAHRHDPISRMRVSTEGYGYLTTIVRSLADNTDAGLGFVLEGGYSLDMLAEGVEMVHEVFAGREPITPGTDVSDRSREVIDTARATHGLGSK